MSREPVSREEVLGALEHTFAPGAARIEFRHELDFDLTESPSPPIRLGPHLRRLMRRPVAEAHVSAEERLDGHTCRRLVAQADLNRAADAVSYELALPSGMDELGQLTRVPLELWVDAERRIRRIRYGSDASSSATMVLTLDLREFGVESPSDWSRLGLAADERRGA